MSTELFLYFCKQTGLSIMELDYMTIGMCMDYFSEYIKQNKKEDMPTKGRNASQADFDSF